MASPKLWRPELLPRVPGLTCRVCLPRVAGLPCRVCLLRGRISRRTGSASSTHLSLLTVVQVSYGRSVNSEITEFRDCQGSCGPHPIYQREFETARPEGGRFAPYPIGQRDSETARPETPKSKSGPAIGAAPWRDWRPNRGGDKSKSMDPNDLPLPPPPPGPPPVRPPPMMPVAPPVECSELRLQLQPKYAAPLLRPSTPAQSTSEDVNSTMIRGLLHALGEIANLVYGGKAIIVLHSLGESHQRRGVV